MVAQITPEPNRQPSSCALFGWTVAGLLDSLTDTFYAGEEPDIKDFGRVMNAVEDVEACGLDTHEVRQLLTDSGNETANGRPDEGKKFAAAARSKMQAILELGPP